MADTSGLSPDALYGREGSSPFGSNNNYGAVVLTVERKIPNLDVEGSNPSCSEI